MKEKKPMTLRERIDLVADALGVELPKNALLSVFHGWAMDLVGNDEVLRGMDNTTRNRFRAELRNRIEEQTKWGNTDVWGNPVDTTKKEEQS